MFPFRFLEDFYDRIAKGVRKIKEPMVTKNVFLSNCRHLFGQTKNVFSHKSESSFRIRNELFVKKNDDNIGSRCVKDPENNANASLKE